MLTSKNVSVDQFADAGIAPNDQRVAPAINACNQYLTTPLKTDFPCTVTNSKGEQVTTTCNQSYAKEVNGALVPISGEDMLIAAGGGEKVVAGNFETTVAQKARLAQEEWAAAEAQRAEAARLAAERRQEEARRAAFLASPEGKRQASAEAAQAAKQRDLAFNEYKQNGLIAINPNRAPLRYIGRDRQWSCDGLVSPKLIQFTFSEVSAIAKANRIAAPSLQTCSYKIQSMGSITMYTIQFFPSNALRLACEAGGACRNLYMTEIVARNNNFYRSHTLIGPDAASTYKACVALSGKLISANKNCRQL